MMLRNKQSPQEWRYQDGETQKDQHIRDNHGWADKDLHRFTPELAPEFDVIRHRHCQANETGEDHRPPYNHRVHHLQYRVLSRLMGFLLQ